VDLLFVLQLVVRLAACSTTCCGLAVRQVVQLVVNLLLAFDPLWVCRTTSRTTNPQQVEAVEHSSCHIASICRGFVVPLVVQHVVQEISDESAHFKVIGQRSSSHVFLCLWLPADST